jgi:hypothetical protein
MLYATFAATGTGSWLSWGDLSDSPLSARNVDMPVTSGNVLPGWRVTCARLACRR